MRGVETPGGADLNAKYRNPQVGTSENVEGGIEEETADEVTEFTQDVLPEESDTNENLSQSITGEEQSSDLDDLTGGDEDNTDSNEQGSYLDFPDDVTIDLSREDSFELPEGAVRWGSNGVEFYGLNDSTNLPFTQERFDYFAWGNTPGTPTTPGTGMGIKYISGDNQTADAEGKYRLAYCLNIFKSSPGLPGGAYHNMTFDGWTNRKVAYAMFYGPIFWGETSRWAPYSTGNWKFDYWVTQMAVHILNGEITYDAVWNSMFGKTTIGGASYNDKILVMDRLRTVVNDANNMANYGAFDSAGWIDLSKAVFNCSGPASNAGFYWDAGSNSYVLNGAFTPSFTMRDQDWHHRASYMRVNTNAGYISHWSSTTIHKFSLSIPKADYEAYQRTGKDIRITVDLGIPKRWGGAVYSYKGDNKIQPVTILSFESGDDVTTFHKEFSYRIPKTTGKVGVQKTSGNTAITNGNANYSLKGAVYTVYSDSGLSNVVGTITTDDNGKGWLQDIPIGTYYVKETKASPGYELDEKTYTVSAES